MSNAGGMVDKTKNVYDSEIKKSSKKCFGCKMNHINRWCVYRNWRDEGRSGYAFRVFQKIHLLPTCSRPHFDYDEREEYKEAYCKELGTTYEELFPNSGSRRGGGGGGAKKKVFKMLC
jgi:hypothetical protein